MEQYPTTVTRDCSYQTSYSYMCLSHDTKFPFQTITCVPRDMLLRQKAGKLPDLNQSERPYIIYSTETS